MDRGRVNNIAWVRVMEGVIKGGGEDLSGTI